MTENETIEYLKITRDCAEDGSIGELQKQMCDIAISALNEIQKYREADIQIKKIFDGQLGLVENVIRI